MSKNKPNLESLIVSLSTKVDDQYSELDKRLDNIEKVMIAQEINLKEHMKRSDNLEEMVKIIKVEDLKPLEKHVTMVEGVFKFLGLMALLVGLASGIASLFGLI
jgi:tetrahydromethanopterin S-methyltransferase subunit G